MPNSPSSRTRITCREEHEIQAIFWGFAFILLGLGLLLGTRELEAFAHPRNYALMMLCALVAIMALGIINSLHARSAILYFEEQPPEVVTRLGLIVVPPAQISELPKSSQS